MQSDNSAIFEIQFLPPISFFRVLLSFPKLHLEIHENYQKRSFRNRCEIASPQGKQTLSVPLVQGKNQQLPITKVQVSYHHAWQKEIWHALEAGYRSSPYFEFYQEELNSLLFQPYQYLIDLDKALLTTIVQWLQMDVTIGHTSDFRTANEAVLLSGHIRPSENRLFQKRKFPPYRQVFSDKYGFLPDLSVVDLIFNMGPESLLYLRTLPEPKITR